MEQCGAGDFAINVLRREQYLIEVSCYERLREGGVDSIGQFDVPILLGKNDELLVIQISFVTPPFLLDFGKAYLDRPPPEMSAECPRTSKLSSAIFGKRRCAIGRCIRYWQLRQIGTYYQDPKPGNIEFGDP